MIILYRLILPVLILVSISAVRSYAGYIEPDRKERCHVCGMSIHKNPGWSAQIVFKDGSRASFDGPKDMFRYYFNMSKYNRKKTTDNISEMYVKGYYSKIPFDASKAFYVIYSHVYGPMGHELIPFKERKTAEGFAGERGGRVLPFQEVTPGIIRSLDHGQKP